MDSDISISRFNKYVIKPLQGEKCSLYLSLVDLVDSFVLPVSSFHRYVGALIYGYFHVHVHQRNGCNRRFSGCLQQNVGELGNAISSWSASVGYSAMM